MENWMNEYTRDNKYLLSSNERLEDDLPTTSTELQFKKMLLSLNTTFILPALKSKGKVR